MSEKEDEKAPQKHATLAAALVAAQREAEDGPMADGKYSGRGKSSGVEVGYSYPKPETSIPWMKAVLNRHGLALHPGGTSADRPAAPLAINAENVLVPIQYSISHEAGETKEWTVWAPVCLPYGGTLMKGWKNTATGCLKYQLMDALNCRTEADDDEGAVPTAAGRKAQEGPPPPIIGAPAPTAQAAPPPVPGGAAPRPLPVPSQAAPAGQASAPAPQPQPPAATHSTSSLQAQADADQAAHAAEFEAIEAAHKRERVERMHAAARATGMPGLAVSQYVLEVVMAGEDVDLSDPAPLHAQKITAALEELARKPLPAAEVAALALRRESFLAALAEEEKGSAPAHSAAGAPTTPPSAAPAPAPQSAPPAASPRSAPPAPPTIPGSAATDQRLAGRFSVFMKRASDERKARGVPNADEEYLNRINAWALIPGLTSFATPIAQTERQVTAAVMDRLEAGLEAWIAERSSKLSLVMAGK